MRSSTLDAPAARNDWLAALTAKLTDLAWLTADIVAAILDCVPF